MPRSGVYPWREGNRFELLVDGNRFFPVMIQAIEQARDAVDAEFYLVEAGRCADRFLQTLCDAAGRGVTVRCLFDGFGTLKLGEAWRQTLREAGVELRHYNPVAVGHGWRNLHRDHRKILVVDGELAFVGGAGITDEFWDGSDGETLWHDVMVRIEGPLVADWRHLFEWQWKRTRYRPVLRTGLAARLRMPPRPEGGEGVGRVAYADARQHRDVLKSMTRALIVAERRIWFATPYFLPTFRVRRLLRRAAQRGLDVRLLMTGPHTDNPAVRFAGQRYYPRLLKAGVRIYEYPVRFPHQKIVLVDDWTSIGSCNFDHWNLRFNLEANVESIDPGFALQVQRCLEEDLRQCDEITLDEWQAQPWWARARTRFWGWMDWLTLRIFGRPG